VCGRTRKTSRISVCPARSILGTNLTFCVADQPRARPCGCYLLQNTSSQSATTFFTPWLRAWRSALHASGPSWTSFGDLSRVPYSASERLIVASTINKLFFLHQQSVNYQLTIIIS
jgi:hypothetical protein